MSTVRTTLGESARQDRFEPSARIAATNVQQAIEVVDAKITVAGTIRQPAAASTIAILASDIEVGIDTTSSAVSATLPSAAAWVAANPGNGLELVLTDIKGHAAANNITPSLNGSDAFAYGGVTPVISANFGSLRLRPMTAPAGWYVRGVN
jgi:hypothetical protein